MNPSLASANTTINSTGASFLKCGATTSDTKVASFTCQISTDSGANERYRLRIGFDPSPTNAGHLQYYQVVVNTFFNQTNITNGTTDGSSQARTLFKGTQVIRDRVVKLIYIKQKGNYNISFYPKYDAVSNDVYVSINSVALGTGSIYTSAAAALTATSTNAENSVTKMTDKVYDIPAAGYYLITVSATQVKNYFGVTFPSDSYTCPYNTNFPDYKQNFQPLVLSKLLS